LKGKRETQEAAVKSTEDAKKDATPAKAKKKGKKKKSADADSAAE
jgi:hypothetical protein